MAKENCGFLDHFFQATGKTEEKKKWQKKNQI